MSDIDVLFLDNLIKDIQLEYIPILLNYLDRIEGETFAKDISFLLLSEIRTFNDIIDKFYSRTKCFQIDSFQNLESISSNKSSVLGINLYCFRLVLEKIIYRCFNLFIQRAKISINLNIIQKCLLIFWGDLKELNEYLNDSFELQDDIMFLDPRMRFTDERWLLINQQIQYIFLGDIEKLKQEHHEMNKILYIMKAIYLKSINQTIDLRKITSLHDFINRREILFKNKFDESTKEYNLENKIMSEKSIQQIEIVEQNLLNNKLKEEFDEYLKSQDTIFEDNGIGLNPEISKVYERKNSKDEEINLNNNLSNSKSPKKKETLKASSRKILQSSFSYYLKGEVFLPV